MGEFPEYQSSLFISVPYRITKDNLQRITALMDCHI